jgi:branched-chain amino acid transport system ATP-binding protein
MSDAALVVEGLTVRHGAVEAVHDLSFEVAPGEIVGLIGPNGAGKSSTLHAVMGLVRPAAGSVRLAGVELTGRRPEDIARAGIALVPEGRRIFADLTVEENLRLGLSGRRAGSRGGGLEAVYDLFPVVQEMRR